MNLLSYINIVAISILLTTATAIDQLGLASNAPTIAHFKNSGAVCQLVTLKPSRPGTISLLIGSVTSDKSKDEIYKVPVLIFKFSDLRNFTNLGPAEAYNELYSQGKDGKIEVYNNLVNFKDLRFDLNLYKDYESIDEAEIYNGYVTTDKTDKDHYLIFFTPQRSGFYCVYVAPQVDLEISDLDIPIVFKSSTGYLNPIQYLVYSLEKILAVLGIFLFGYLLNYILKFKIGQDFKNMNSISLISRGIIFYLLLPYIFLVICSVFVYFLQNNWYTSALAVLVHLSSILFALSFLFEVVFRYFILLFSMGYGVIYYHKGNSRNYRVIPARLLNRAKWLLIINSVAGLIFAILSDSWGDVNSSPLKQYSGLSVSNLPTNSSFIRYLTLVVSTIVGFAPLVWFSLSIYYYFQTKKVIAKFTPVEEQGGFSNDQITSAFRKSILVIFVLPVFVFLLVGLLYVWRVVKMVKGHPIGDFPEERVPAEVLAYTILLTEQLLLDKRSWLGLIWTGILYLYFQIVLVYFIWIKGNNGIIVDSEGQDPIAYADVSQYEISEDENEEETPLSNGVTPSS